MPAPLGHIKCLCCSTWKAVHLRRDLTRKKYCSRRCQGIATDLKRRENPRAYAEWVEKMRRGNTTPESNALKKHVGIDHPRYKHDRTTIKSPRPRYENSQWRKAVFERDNYTCQFCGQRGGSLQADHILPYHSHTEVRWSLDNGRTLCVSCHKKTPTYGRPKKETSNACCQ